MIDWQALEREAIAAQERAYAPYSGFSVGAAALVDDGRVVSGCNVENAGYGVTLCAECGLVSDLVYGGGGKLLAFACVGGPDAGITMPCGRCRQLLNEFKAPGMQVLTPAGPQPFDAILPMAFGPADLADVAGGAGVAQAAADPVAAAEHPVSADPAAASTASAATASAHHLAPRPAGDTA